MERKLIPFFQKILDGFKNTKSNQTYFKNSAVKQIKTTILNPNSNNPVEVINYSGKSNYSIKNTKENLKSQDAEMRNIVSMKRKKTGKRGGRYIVRYSKKTGAPYRQYF